MGYVVSDLCIKCKYQDCVEVCPVDAFYEGKNMLVISQEICIDCGVCGPECPAEAILPDELSPEWIDLNVKYSGIWPLITARKQVPVDADDYLNVEDKMKLYFHENDS